MIEEVLAEKEVSDHRQSVSFDLVVVGSGPAGMSAALCAARSKLKVLILDMALPGGQASTSYKVTNYLGFPEGILGVDLATQMESCMTDFDIEYACETVTNVFNVDHPIKVIETDLGTQYKTKSIIIATGLEPKQMGLSFEQQFLGRGVSYYAQSDADSYVGKPVAVIGGGNCACYAADYLSDYASQLYLIHRSDDIKAVKSLKEKVMTNPKISLLWDTEPVEALGVDKIEKLKLFNHVTNQNTWLDVSGVFIYVGRIPSAEVVSMDVNIDEGGFIITDEYMRTNIEGVYAAGDIRSKQIRQIATAVSDGMIAAINVEKYIFR
ncbi:MAG: thioredoxin-disulfide reductase [Actinobacteria bacterium]|nr:thioredoxin-disulfide reductase [Actinomycetota bacterium]